MPTITDLPDELLELVVEELPAFNDHSNLSLVNKQIHDAVKNSPGRLAEFHIAAGNPIARHKFSTDVRREILLGNFSSLHERFRGRIFDAFLEQTLQPRIADKHILLLQLIQHFARQEEAFQSGERYDALCDAVRQLDYWRDAKNVLLELANAFAKLAPNERTVDRYNTFLGLVNMGGPRKVDVLRSAGCVFAGLNAADRTADIYGHLFAMVMGINDVVYRAKAMDGLADAFAALPSVYATAARFRSLLQAVQQLDNRILCKNAFESLHKAFGAISDGHETEYDAYCRDLSQIPYPHWEVEQKGALFAKLPQAHRTLDRYRTIADQTQAIVNDNSENNFAIHGLIEAFIALEPDHRIVCYPELISVVIGIADESRRSEAMSPLCRVVEALPDESLTVDHWREICEFAKEFQNEALRVKAMASLMRMKGFAEASEEEIRQLRDELVTEMKSIVTKSENAQTLVAAGESISLLPVEYNRSEFFDMLVNRVSVIDQKIDQIKALTAIGSAFAKLAPEERTPDRYDKFFALVKFNIGYAFSFDVECPEFFRAFSDAYNSLAPGHRTPERSYVFSTLLKEIPSDPTPREALAASVKKLEPPLAFDLVFTRRVLPFTMDTGQKISTLHDALWVQAAITSWSHPLAKPGAGAAFVTLVSRDCAPARFDELVELVRSVSPDDNSHKAMRELCAGFAELEQKHRTPGRFQTIWELMRSSRFESKLALFMPHAATAFAALKPEDRTPECFDELLQAGLTLINDGAHEVTNKPSEVQKARYKAAAEVTRGVATAYVALKREDRTTARYEALSQPVLGQADKARVVRCIPDLVTAFVALEPEDRTVDRYEALFQAWRNAPNHGDVRDVVKAYAALKPEDRTVKRYDALLQVVRNMRGGGPMKEAHRGLAFREVVKAYAELKPEDRTIARCEDLFEMVQAIDKGGRASAMSGLATVCAALNPRDRLTWWKKFLEAMQTIDGFDQSLVMLGVPTALAALEAVHRLKYFEEHLLAAQGMADASLRARTLKYFSEVFAVLEAKDRTSARFGALTQAVLALPDDRLDRNEALQGLATAFAALKPDDRTVECYEETFVRPMTRPGGDIGVTARLLAFTMLKPDDRTIARFEGIFHAVRDMMYVVSIEALYKAFVSFNNAQKNQIDLTTVAVFDALLKRLEGKEFERLRAENSEELDTLVSNIENLIDELSNGGPVDNAEEYARQFEMLRLKELTLPLHDKLMRVKSETLVCRAADQPLETQFHELLTRLSVQPEEAMQEVSWSMTNSDERERKTWLEHQISEIAQNFKEMAPNLYGLEPAGPFPGKSLIRPRSPMRKLDDKRLYRWPLKVRDGGMRAAIAQNCPELTPMKLRPNPTTDLSITPFFESAAYVLAVVNTSAGPFLLGLTAQDLSSGRLSLTRTQLRDATGNPVSLYVWPPSALVPYALPPLPSDFTSPLGLEFNSSGPSSEVSADDPQNSKGKTPVYRTIVPDPPPSKRPDAMSLWLKAGLPDDIRQEIDQTPGPWELRITQDPKAFNGGQVSGEYSIAGSDGLDVPHKLVKLVTSAGTTQKFRIAIGPIAEKLPSKGERISGDFSKKYAANNNEAPAAATGKKRAGRA